MLCQHAQRIVPQTTAASRTAEATGQRYNLKGTYLKLQARGVARKALTAPNKAEELAPLLHECWRIKGHELLLDVRMIA